VRRVSDTNKNSFTVDPAYEVFFDVTNTGDRDGDAVAEVYIADTHSNVPRPPKELKGFTRISLHPGEKKRATVPLDLRAFTYFDVNEKHWHAEAGAFRILVGSSSEQIELQDKVTLENPIRIAP